MRRGPRRLRDPRNWWGWLQARLRNESGIALVMAIVIMAMLSLGVTTSIILTSSGQRHAFRSNGDQKAYALAEDGVNSATAVIFANDPPTNLNCDSTAPGYDPAWDAYKALLPERTTTRPEGSVTWSGAFACGGPPDTTDGKYWTVTSVATVKNPTGGGVAALSRVVKARVPLGKTQKVTMTTETVPQEVETTTTWTETVWIPGTTTRTVTNTSTTYDDPGFSGGSFFYSWGDIDACQGTGGAEIATSIITEGNFCLRGGSAQVQASAALVSIKGTITLQNGAVIGMGPTPPPWLVYPLTASDTVAAVVTSTAGFPGKGMVIIDGEYLKYAGIGTQSNKCDNKVLQPGQGCFQSLERGFLPDRPAAAHAAGAVVDGRVAAVETQGGCGSSCGGIYAVSLRTGSNAQLANIPKPTIVVSDARRDAAPGPNHLPGGSCPAGLFSTTSGAPYFNDATVDLTPASSYTCTATAPDGTTGELSWNNTTKELKVRGVVYIPSNVAVTQDLYYTTFGAGSPHASATMFIAGTLDYSKHNICALRQTGKTDCDTRTWDPNVHSELAAVMPNLPGQTGIATNPSHGVTALNSGQFQGFLYTDGTVNREGGNGYISGTVFAASMIFQGGASTAPAPGVFRLPLGVYGTPHVTTTYTTTTETTSVPVETTRVTTTTATVYVSTTHATTVTTPGPTTPGDFGG